MSIRQAEVIEKLGVDYEQLRRWKRALPPLASFRGNKPQYTFGDVLALKVVHQLGKDLGIPATVLTPLSDELFKQCRLAATLRAKVYLVFSPLAGRVFLRQPTDLLFDPALEGPQILVPLSPHLEAIHKSYLQGQQQEGELQQNLPLTES